MALKWDRVWWKISAFNLPVPPFQLGSTLDPADLTRRLAAVVPVAAASVQAPCNVTYPALSPPSTGFLDHFIISARRLFSQKPPPR